MRGFLKAADSKKLEWALLALALLAILGVTISVVHSFDVFWQLQSGRYMIQTGSLINKDVFTLAADSPRFEHCWLHDIALYLIYLVGGYAAISIWKGVTILATVALLIAAARIRCSSVTAILTALPLTLLTSPGWLERPQLWTFLCFAWFIYCLEHYRVTRGNLIFTLFPAMVFWANAHAGSVLGVLVVTAYLAGATATSLCKEKKFGFRDHRTLWITTGLVLLGASITTNPAHWLRLLMKASDIGARISNTGEVVGGVKEVFNMDWTPTTFAMAPMFFYIVAAVAGIMLICYRKYDFKDLFLLGGLALMGMSLIRHIPFFYFGCLAILPRYLDHLAGLLQRVIKPAWALPARMVLLAGILFCFWVLYQPLYHVYGLFHTGLRTWHYPIEATEFIQQHQLPGNIYNTYDWGGYLAWELFPGYRVFWDGRQIDTKMFELGLQVMTGKQDWEKILDKFAVNTIVHRSLTIDTGQMYPLLDQLRKSQDWHLVFNDESSMVFVRDGSVSPEWLARFERPKDKMDDTILSEAHLTVHADPNRYLAWWEMARVYLKRKQYQRGRAAIQQYLVRAPHPHPEILKIYQRLNQQLTRKFPSPRP